eukprot:gb/GFBE01044403.1/.p1 GENE.gb/GFBE01044403.1/~~gb/GFBE01044403.1/.p1  ORF type:complete len:181 (+),score=13.22 gb/GFBE01044403.1/:1-543(+)
MLRRYGDMVLNSSPRRANSHSTTSAGSSMDEVLPAQRRTVSTGAMTPIPQKLAWTSDDDRSCAADLLLTASCSVESCVASAARQEGPPSQPSPPSRWAEEDDQQDVPQFLSFTASPASSCATECPGESLLGDILRRAQRDRDVSSRSGSFMAPVRVNAMTSSELGQIIAAALAQEDFPGE